MNTKLMTNRQHKIKTRSTGLTDNTVKKQAGTARQKKEGGLGLDTSRKAAKKVGQNGAGQQ